MLPFFVRPHDRCFGLAVLPAQLHIMPIQRQYLFQFNEECEC